MNGLYEVSNLGNVKSLNYSRTGMVKILKYNKDKRGYLIVTLSKNNTQTTKRIHKLVALAFIPNPKNKTQINHIDCNKQNNCVQNLEWCTSSENIKHAWANGLKSKKYQVELGKSRAKKAYQYSLDGKFIKKWNSATEAGEALGILQQCISTCRSGKTKTAGGYVWKYEKVEEE